MTGHRRARCRGRKGAAGALHIDHRSPGVQNAPKHPLERVVHHTRGHLAYRPPDDLLAQAPKTRCADAEIHEPQVRIRHLQTERGLGQERTQNRGVGLRSANTGLPGQERAPLHGTVLPHDGRQLDAYLKRMTVPMPHADQITPLARRHRNLRRRRGAGLCQQHRHVAPHDLLGPIAEQRLRLRAPPGDDTPGVDRQLSTPGVLLPPPIRGSSRPLILTPFRGSSRGRYALAPPPPCPSSRGPAALRQRHRPVVASLLIFIVLPPLCGSTLRPPPIAHLRPLGRRSPGRVTRPRRGRGLDGGRPRATTDPQCRGATYRRNPSHE